MAEADSISFHSWRAPGFSGEIFTSESILKELRDFAVDGYLRLSRGGIEVGGVMFGEKEGTSIWVIAWRPIACEHLYGPSFHLSEKDIAGVAETIAQATADPELEGLEPVGWFVSHTRSELHIRPTELEFWDQCFGGERQVALVLKPARFQPVRAGYFFRNDLGHVAVEGPACEFTLPADEPKPRTELQLRPVPQMGGTAAAPALERRQQAVMLDTVPDEERTFLRERAQLRSPKKRRKAWGLILSVIAGALLGSIVRIGLMYYWDTHPDSLGLKLKGQQAELLVQWDREQINQLKGMSGEITITEDNMSLVKAINAEDLKLGSFVYYTQAHDVKVELRVFRDGRASIMETARLLTQPPPPPPPPPDEEIEAAPPKEKRRAARARAAKRLVLKAEQPEESK